MLRKGFHCMCDWGESRSPFDVLSSTFLDMLRSAVEYSAGFSRLACVLHILYRASMSRDRRWSTELISLPRCVLHILYRVRLPCYRCRQHFLYNGSVEFTTRFHAMLAQTIRLENDNRKHNQFFQISYIIYVYVSSGELPTCMASDGMRLRATLRVALFEMRGRRRPHAS